MLGHDQLAALGAQTGGGGDVVAFVQYGVLGLVVVGFILGWIWPKPAVERLERDKVRAETQADELARVYQAEIIPTLTLVLRRLEQGPTNGHKVP